MTQHAYLDNPEHARAYAYLTANPKGSVRKWAEAMEWKRCRMERFLLKLLSHGLCAIHSAASNCGSTFEATRPTIAPGVLPGVSHRVSATVRDASETRPRHLYLGGTASRSGLTASRCADAVENSVDGVACPDPNIDAERLIVAVNEILEYRFGDNYKPIRPDNHGSLKAARSVLDESVPVEEAVVLMRRQALAYTPDKTGGDLPRSLGHPFFARTVIRKWKLLERERLQLPLLPQLDMTIERTDPPTPNPIVEHPAIASPAAFDAWRSAYLEAGTTRQRGGQT